MTISSTTRKAGPFAGNGVNTSFPFSFKVFDDTDVELLLVDPNGNETTLVLDSDYSIALNADQNNAPGGTITYPKTGTPLASTYQLIALGDVPNDQPTDLTNSGGFYPDVIMNMVDRSTVQIQQLAEVVSRSIVVTPADTTAPTLPPGAERANTVLGFDASGNLTVLPITASVGAGDMRVDTFISTALPNPTNLPTFTPGTSNQTVLSRAPGSVFNAWFFFDAAYQGPDQVTSVVGKIVTFTGAIPVGVQRVYAITGTTLSIYSPSSGSVVDASVAAGSKLFNRTNDEISVTDYPGADPIGLNDSLAAFNAAAVSSVTLGKTVYVPGGTWKLSAQPTIGRSSWRLSPNATFTTVWPNFKRGIWTDIDGTPYGHGANINYFNDRVMVGTSTLYDGKHAPTFTDWLGSFNPIGGQGAYEYLLINAQMAVGAQLGNPSIVGYVRTSDSQAAGNAGIGVSAVAVNDNAVGAGADSWAFYGTSVRTAAATGQSTLGLELETANLGSLVSLNPYAMFTNGLTASLWLGPGGELISDPTLTFNPVSVCLGVLGNPKSGVCYDKGIIFASNSIRGTDGVSGVGTAIQFAKGHSMVWTATSSGLATSQISSNTANYLNEQQIQFTDNGLLVTDGSGLTQFRVNRGVNGAANYIMTNAADTGFAPAIQAIGTDTNVDLALIPQAAGYLSFGNYTAGTFAQTGYITIKDAAGGLRRLMVG